MRKPPFTPLYPLPTPLHRGASSQRGRPLLVRSTSSLCPAMTRSRLAWSHSPSLAASNCPTLVPATVNSASHKAGRMRSLLPMKYSPARLTSSLV